MRKIKIVVPVATAAWNELVLEDMGRYKAGDTELAVVNIEKGPESIECTYDVAWAELLTVQECEKAEAEGCNGVIIYCFGDPGLRAAKEKLDIPVVGINEPAVHFASMLGNRFSIMAVGPDTVNRAMLVDNVLLYGLESRCASIRFLSMPVLELETQKDKQTKRLFEEAQKAVEEDGADTIVLGCGSMFGVEKKIRNELNVSVVVPGPVALRTCEALIDLGLAQSKRFFAAPPSKKRVMQEVIDGTV